MPIIIIDTTENANKDEYLEKIKTYDSGILCLSDKAIIASKLLTGEQEILYTNIIPININSKAELLNLLNVKTLASVYVVFFVTIIIYLFVIYFTSNLVDVVVLGALGYLFARIINLRLRYKATFNIGLYSLTLPVILNLIYIAVNTFTGFEIKYFQWMYTTISYIYVAVAILMIKTEIINQRIQLIKLKEIQEKASKEEKEETKEENEETEKENKENKEEKEESSGEEPEGSNA